MTPHDLINLPGAGNAEKWLRANGMWRITMTDTERIEWIAENCWSVRLADLGWRFNINQSTNNIDVEYLQADIDEAAVELAMHKPKEPNP